MISPPESDPGLSENRAQHRRELRGAVEGARAVVVRDAAAASLFGVELIQLEERLDVVADEADGRDDDAADALATEPLQLVFEVGFEPSHLAVARLEAERPRVLQAARHG